MSKSDKHFAVIRQAAALLIICLAAAACGLTERISTSRTVEVDSVRQQVPTPGHVYERRFLPADSLLFEDDRIKIAITRLPDSALPADVVPRHRQIAATDSASDVSPDSAAPAFSLSDYYQLRAEIKPGSTEVDVPQKTITEERTETKFVKQTPDLVKYLIGGLIALILIMVVAWKIKR